MKRFAILTVALAAGCAATGSKKVAGENLRPGPYRSVEDVPVGAPADFQPVQPERLTLANGTRVLLMRDDERPVVELTVRYAAGSYDDPLDRTGLASMTASVMRLGGSARPEACSAARMRSRLSATALSGRPTMFMPILPGATMTCTSTGTARMP